MATIDRGYISKQVVDGVTLTYDKDGKITCTQLAA